MTGVRFGAIAGWEGLCPKGDGGCGQWFPLDNTCWNVTRTLKRCRDCENKRVTSNESYKVRHAARQRQYRKEKPELMRSYQEKYRLRRKVSLEEARKQSQLRRDNIKALLQEGLDAA